MAAIRQRVEGQEAFVLQLHPFRETSMLAEIFSRGFGRLALVARGARRPRSALRGLLMEFQPLTLSWFGSGEVRTLAKAEWPGGHPPLTGRGLLFGYYLNELLLRLLAREDPHPELFAHYGEALDELAAGKSSEATLRRFEMRMLRALGYGLTLDRDVHTGVAVRPDGHYAFVMERGVVEAPGAQTGPSVFSGRALLAMAREDFTDAETLAQGKILMRQALGHYLGDKPLNTRRVFVELNEL